MRTFNEVADYYNLQGTVREQFLQYVKARWEDVEDYFCETGCAEDIAHGEKVGVKEKTKAIVCSRCGKEIFV